MSAKPAKPPTPVHWTTGEGDDYGWMVGRVEGSSVTCRHSYRLWEIYRGDELLRKGMVEDHQVARSTARQQRVVSLYEVAERICEANARMFAKKAKTEKPTTPRKL
jgi:hypothetical protein